MKGPFPASPGALAAGLAVSIFLATATLSAQGTKGGASTSAGKAAKEKAARDVAVERALLKATAKVETSHAKELEKVALWAISIGLKEEAADCLGRIAALDPDHAGLPKLRERSGKVVPPPDAAKLAEAKKAYAAKIEDTNEKNAKRLFDLAASCMKLGLFTRAYDLVTAVLAADPDHKRARDILGWAWDAGSKTWISKWEASMRKTHFLTEEGWVKKADKKKWDGGLREYLGKWVSKEEEARIRTRNEFNPFKVETEHFDVGTNLGRKQALEFALLLEDFYREFFRFYVGFYDQEAGAKLLFNQARLKSKHRVKVFPSRAEYETFVKLKYASDKLLMESAGFWSGGDRMSYFYGTEDREDTLSTLYHEVTHQLFGETKVESGSSKGNNWVVEGIASYMETWEKVDGKWIPGRKLTGRLMSARSFLAANPDWKLAPFLALDNKDFHEANRGLNYELGAALSHFLMHADDGVYRERYVKFISAYYGGKVVESSLGAMISVEGVSGIQATIEAIEKRLKEYMSRLGEKDGETPAVTKEEDEAQ